jgi:Spy/CpxP family protein refolding chaperone
MISQEKTKLKATLTLVGVFVLGGLTGAALNGAYIRHVGYGPPQAHGEFLGKLQRELNLTDSQSAQIRAIIDETRIVFKDISDESRPKFDAARQKSRDRIRAVLSPDQQQRFDQLTSMMDAKRGERERFRDHNGP